MIVGARLRLFFRTALTPPLRGGAVKSLVGVGQSLVNRR